MHQGIQSLSEREKETLRLLLGGHDAKSIARVLGLSVHTVNERLRDARRKLGVSSSSEAARLLAETEERRPDSIADKEFGVAVRHARASIEQPNRRPGAGYALAWLGGGMLIMSLIVAALVFSSAFHGSGTAEPPAPLLASAASPSASETDSVSSARKWLGLVDHRGWNESWSAAGALFRAEISAAQWASTIQPVREPLGPVSSRSVKLVTK